MKRTADESKNRNLRQVLADSHVAAVAIAVLLLASLDGAFRSLWPLVSRALDFLFTAVAILDIPFFSPAITVLNRMMLIIMFTYLYSAVVSLAAAWLLSRWVYGMGPLSSLAAYRSRMPGDKRV